MRIRIANSQIRNTDIATSTIPFIVPYVNQIGIDSQDVFKAKHE